MYEYESIGKVCVVHGCSCQSIDDVLGNKDRRNTTSWLAQWSNRKQYYSHWPGVCTKCWFTSVLSVTVFHASFSPREGRSVRLNNRAPLIIRSFSIAVLVVPLSVQAVVERSILSRLNAASQAHSLRIGHKTVADRQQSDRTVLFSEPKCTELEPTQAALHVGNRVY